LDDYEVRAYEPDDEEQIVLILIKVFHGWLKYDYDCTPEEHYDWKYFDVPVMRSVPATVTLNDDRIVGCFHDFQTTLKLGEKEVTLGKGSDLAVDPEHRE
jgi:hypothetical protein